MDSEENFDEALFEEVIEGLGKLYRQFREMTKLEGSPVAPNDHILGPIGEWRAIQLLREKYPEKIKSVIKNSSKPTDPDDLKITATNGKENFLSVKSVTAYSKSKKTGKMSFRGRWQWTQG